MRSHSVCLAQALECSRRTWGHEHSNTLVVMANLAKLCTCRGDFERARALLDEALPAQRQAQGDEHPNTLYMLGVAGNLYRHAGEHQEARELFQEVRNTTADLVAMCLLPVSWLVPC
jgi:tetratricopeptide (TPR) repeat protein